MNKKTYAVDFDGTLCENKYPDIGEPINAIINYVKKLKEEGHYLILWTCRTEDELKNAEQWCKDKGILFDAVNANLQSHINKYNGDTRKVFADGYIDDKAITLESIIKQEVN